MLDNIIDQMTGFLTGYFYELLYVEVCFFYWIYYSSRKLQHKFVRTTTASVYLALFYSSASETNEVTRNKLYVKVIEHETMNGLIKLPDARDFRIIP